MNQPLIIEHDQPQPKNASHQSPLTKVKINQSDAIAEQVSDIGTGHLHKTKQPIDVDFDPTATLQANLLGLWTRLSSALRHGYLLASTTIFDEILLRASEKQLNDALYQFVVKNVEMVHHMHIALHDNWLRLSVTVYTSGVFASVACNFRLVSIELNGEYQRLVFEQLTDTEILSLHSKQWYIASLAKMGVRLYRGVLNKDPLPLALKKINVKGEPFAVHKGNYIYLDISRYFANSPDIVSYFQKAQVNTGYTSEGNLLANVQINYSQLLNFGVDGDDIISDKDDPAQHPL